jgi:hypothetical protein
MPEAIPSRRDFVAALAALGCASPSAAGVAPPSSNRPGGHGLPIYDLNLPPEVLADLEAFAQEVIRDVRYLDELPLEDVPPAFVFVPRSA